MNGSGPDTADLNDRDRQTLQDLARFCRMADDLVARGRDAFDEDEMLRLASESIVLKMGEAIGRLPASFRDRHPQVPWKAMAGSRIVVAHKYHRTDYAIIWNALESELDPLMRLLAQYREGAG